MKEKIIYSIVIVHEHSVLLRTHEREVIMTVREQLENIRIQSTMIDSKVSEIQSLREIASSVVGVLQSVPEHAVGTPSDKVGNTIAKIIDLEDEVKNELEKLLNLRQESLKLIEQVSDPMEYKILYMRYFQFKTWSSIAEETRNTREGARQICFRAVNKLEQKKS